MKKICLLAALLLALSAPAAQAAQGGSVTGTTHTKGTERAMQIRSDEMLSTGTVSWDVAAPKNKKPQQRADVWLIREDFAFSKLSDEAIDALYKRQEIPAGAPIYRTHSDAKGAYRFEEIPPGRYYLMTLDPFGKPFDEGAGEILAACVVGLLQDVVHVRLHGSQRQLQLARDVLIVLALQHEGEDLPLACGHAVAFAVRGQQVVDLAVRMAVDDPGEDVGEVSAEEIPLSAA